MDSSSASARRAAFRKLALASMAAASVWFCACSSQKPPQERAAEKKATSGPAPAAYRVEVETSKGPFDIEVTRDWAPRAADRFYELVNSGYYNNARFYRVVRNFVAQFGISADPSLSQLWSSMRMPDDPVKEHNLKGTLSFAMNGPMTRTTQVFINLRDNRSLDRQGFAPFGRVVSGMEIVDKLYSGYGDMAPRGSGPDAAKIELQGNAYLDSHFPRLDYIKSATVHQM